MADYSTGLTIDDASAELYYTRGRLYHFQGKKELAELDLNRVLESDTLVKVDSRRQYALLFLGKNDEAIAWVDSMVANNRDLDAIKSLPAYTKLVEEYKQK